jgi:hypothetical protein
LNKRQKSIEGVFSQVRDIEGDLRSIIPFEALIRKLKTAIGCGESKKSVLIKD